MDNFGIFLIYAAIAAFSFFVASPMILNAISTFGVQKRFASEMIDKGIIKEESVKSIQSQKQIGGIIIAAIVFVALLIISIKIKQGFISMAIGMLAGFIRYRHIIQFNNLTVRRFQNTYKGQYDTKKLNDYIEKTF